MLMQMDKGQPITMQFEMSPPKMLMEAQPPKIMEPERERGLTINEIVSKNNSFKLTNPYPLEVPALHQQLNRNQRRKAERLKKKMK